MAAQPRSRVLPLIWLASSGALVVAQLEPELRRVPGLVAAATLVWGSTTAIAIVRLDERYEARWPLGVSLANIAAGALVIRVVSSWLPPLGTKTAALPVPGALRLGGGVAIWVGIVRLVASAIDRVTRPAPKLLWKISLLALLSAGMGVAFAASSSWSGRTLEDRLVALAIFSAILVLTILGTTRLLMRPLSAQLETLLGQLAAIGRGDFSASLQVQGRDELAQVARTFNAMASGLREKDLLERAFGRYVTTAVWNAVRSQSGLEVPTSRREATVLFADVRGFTSLSEALDPAEVLQLLNSYFTRMLEVVAEAEGYVNKFIGDAVMVVFNAPMDQPDHAARAVRCAVQMQLALAELNRSGRLLRPLAIGIGVNTGPLVAGNLGSERRAEYTVIGDTVNVASRLTGTAKAGDVVIGGSTAQQVEGTIPFEALPPLVVKGKSQPLAAFRLRPPGEPLQAERAG